MRSSIPHSAPNFYFLFHHLEKTNILPSYKFLMSHIPPLVLSFVVLSLWHLVAQPGPQSHSHWGEGGANYSLAKPELSITAVSWTIPSVSVWILWIQLALSYNRDVSFLINFDKVMINEDVNQRRENSINWSENGKKERKWNGNWRRNREIPNVC